MIVKGIQSMAYFSLGDIIKMQERIKAILQRDPSDEIIRAEGWVRTKRDSKNVCFLEVNDGSSLKGLQVVIDKASFNNDDLLSQITTGCSVECSGHIVASLGGNQKVEMQLDKWFGYEVMM